VIRGYDSGGVSIEGAIPANGHLGAIVYGHTARNDLEMENGHSLFATIGRAYSSLEGSHSRPLTKVAACLPRAHSPER
jgi:hypothetical protein